MKQLIPLLLFTAVLMSLELSSFSQAIRASNAWLHDSDHRLPNIRVAPVQCRLSFVREFIELQPWTERKTIAFFGDSHMFGNGHPLENTIPYLATPSPYLPINLSIINAHPDDIVNVLELLEYKQIKPDMSIATIKHTHFKKFRSKGGVETRVNLLSYLPYNLGYYYCAARYRNTIEPYFTERLNKPRETYSHIELGDRYMQINGKAIDRYLPPMLEKLSETKRPTLVYLLPHALEAFDEYGFNKKDYREISRYLMQLCTRYRGVECLDLSERLTLPYFHDVAHPNSKGIHAISELLQTRIRALQP
ncbi:MAG: hypothetical protein SFT92_06145 [Rickettsiales bacterium]|nr:hypothetical protein [Rickettsiales bacterium]